MSAVAFVDPALEQTPAPVARAAETPSIEISAATARDLEALKRYRGYATESQLVGTTLVLARQITEVAAKAGDTFSFVTPRGMLDSSVSVHGLFSDAIAGRRGANNAISAIGDFRSNVAREKPAVKLNASNVKDLEKIRDYLVEQRLASRDMPVGDVFRCSVSVLRAVEDQVSGRGLEFTSTRPQETSPAVTARGHAYRL